MVRERKIPPPTGNDNRPLDVPPIGLRPFSNERSQLYRQDALPTHFEP